MMHDLAVDNWGKIGGPAIVETVDGRDEDGGGGVGHQALGVG
jgi:hypothetical protein